MSHELSEYLDDPDAFLDGTQRRWLEKPGRPGMLIRRFLYAINRPLMSTCFRLQVEGLDNLPDSGPFLLTPNHASSLDPFVLAAALPFSVLRNLYWAGRRGAVLKGPRKWVNRWTGVLPLDRDVSGLAVGAAVLQRGGNLVWFPEGTRSREGELQDFKTGVGFLIDHFQVPAVPVYIRNTHEVMPPGASRPRRFAPITVRFETPLHPQVDAPSAVADPERAEELADSLHDKVENAKEQLA